MMPPPYDHPLPPGIASVMLDIVLPDGSHYVVEVNKLKLDGGSILKIEEHYLGQDLTADDRVVSSPERTIDLRLEGTLLRESPHSSQLAISYYPPEEDQA